MDQKSLELNQGNTVQGGFDSRGQPKLSVRVTGTESSADLDAIVDTGFNGYICIPIAVAVSIGLALSGTIDVTLANGSTHRELLFRARVQLGEQDYPGADVLLSGSDDALLGDRMFQGMKLEIDYSNRTVELKPSPRKKIRSR